MKSKLEGLREAWAEEEKEKEARSSKRFYTFAKVSWIQFDFCIAPCFVQENAMRQEKLEREMCELKENTLEEEEVVRMVEMKCAKLRQEIFLLQN